jgi:uncharacterized protein (DUF433 family)
VSGQRINLSVPDEIHTAIEQIAQQTARSSSEVVEEMLAEAVKMRQVRGIVFADEFQRREAKVGGTGLGVWEVIEGYLRAGEDWENFKEAYDWLSEFQLRAALAYWRAYPEEIDEQIRENESWTPEKLYATYPFMKPRPRAPKATQDTSEA